MAGQNCWEFKNCGREPGGAKSRELGVCPASVMESANGINAGKMGGRACWAISGTLCGGQVQGTFASKLANCMDCEFYTLVLAQEGDGYSKTAEIFRKLGE